MSPILTTKEAALYLGISESYLVNMRNLDYAHDGPEYTKGAHKRGIACYYTLKALDAWKAQHTWRGWRKPRKAA